MKMMKKLLYIITLFTFSVGIGQSENLFDQGKEHYKNGTYQEAISSWMQILDKGEASASLYFNLGNAHYKLNNIGPSIFYYEKALQLAPNDSEIKNNLAFAENARIDAIEPLPQSIFTKWHQSIANIFSFDGWAITAIVFSILFAILFLSYYFSATERRKRLYFASSSVVLLLLITAFSMAYLTHRDYEQTQMAIIFADQLDVKSEPTMGSNPVFTLHEGTKVQITSKDGDWLRILLADGKDGWVPASDLKQL